MEVITIESRAFCELVQKIETIAEFVFKQQSDPHAADDNVWLNSEELADMLGVSTRTLQRLRVDNRIAYTKLGRKCIYRLSDVQQAINSRIVECDPSTLDEYRKNYLLANGEKRGGVRRLFWIPILLSSGWSALWSVLIAVRRF